MNLIDRIASKIAAQRGCPRAFPCQFCGTEEVFDGAGCRVIAFAALTALKPDDVNEDDVKRAVKVSCDLGGAVTPILVVEVVDGWIEEALLDD